MSSPQDERFEFLGYYPICECDSVFVAISNVPVAPHQQSGWFRDKLECTSCRSVPRERALAHILSQYCPNWRNISIHECSPVLRGLSLRLLRECRGYVMTQYSKALPDGQINEAGWRNENIEKQTFEDAVFDLVITQDVFEHLFFPGRAVQEIARTLKPGGVCIMTVPVVRPLGSTERRAAMVNGEILHLKPEQYHGNPIGDGRSLVTVDWSYAIGSYLTAQSGLPFVVHVIDNKSMGIHDPFNVVLAARKPPLEDLLESSNAFLRLS